MIQANDLIEKFRYALDNKWGYIWGTAGDLWTQAKQNQKVNYMVKNYGATWQKNSDAKDDHYYSAALYGAKWIGHMVSDCSGMFVWSFKQFGLAMSHISTTIYKSYCGTKGRLTDSLKKTIPPGAAVFTGDTESNHPHVGLYVGNGKVIEASGTQAGVVTSNITAGKWKWYGLLKNVQYEAAPEPDTEPLTIRKGSKGDAVKRMQTILFNLGYDLGKWGIDGDFGSATEKALKEFQSDNRLEVDGVCGPATWAALEKAEASLKEPVKEETYSVTIYHLDRTQAEAIANNYPGSTINKE